MSKELLIFLLSYLALISAVTCVITIADKIKAGKGAFRIPEKTLLILAFLGGSVAEYLTMRCIRHKTLHKKFMIGLPVIIALQILIFAFFIFKIYFTLKPAI